ncbi:MAG: hypothetical protein ACOZAH_05085 [Pseudomonadota bacterium]
MADTINNHAPVLTIHMGEQTPESRRQAAFAEDTGIHCNRPTRETFEWLMEHHGFTRGEIANAWRADTLLWSDNEQRVKIKTNWLVYSVMGWGMFLLSLAMILTATFSLVLGRYPNPETALVYFGATLVFSFSLWVSARSFIHPYRTAQRVKRVLATV